MMSEEGNKTTKDEGQMTSSLSLSAEFVRRCQKPDYRRVGNWMARHVTRPLALYITRLVLPLGVTPHMATAAAWLVGLMAVAAFGCETVLAWLVGGALLQVWYLLDHVDGQLARYLGAESLDGAALDYLMHHSMNLLVPIGVGWGLAADGERIWLLLGIAWGVGALLIGLVNDTRYKAFIKRLKRVSGELQVIGGGGGRPSPAMSIPRSRRAAVWLAKKACEPHVVMNLLMLLGVTQWLIGDRDLLLGRCYVSFMGFVAPSLAAAVVVRGVRQQAAELEFKAWYRLPPGYDLLIRNGNWLIAPREDKTNTDELAAVADVREVARANNASGDRMTSAAA